MIKHTNHCLLTLWSHKPEVQDKYEMSIEKTVFPRREAASGAMWVLPTESAFYFDYQTASKIELRVHFGYLRDKDFSARSKFASASK